MAHHPLYHIWHGMLSRCYNHRSTSYRYYGGKGITVCDEWRTSFEAFKRDMGPRPQGTTLDRILSDRGYSPSNCRWATITEQNNNKSDTRLIEWNGKTQNMTSWAHELGMSAAVLHYRLTKMGLSVEEAFTIPVSRSNRHGIFGKAV